jgi:hypothetical protein
MEETGVTSSEAADQTVHAEFECVGIIEPDDCVPLFASAIRPGGSVVVRIEVFPGDLLRRLIEYLLALS